MYFIEFNKVISFVVFSLSVELIAICTATFHKAAINRQHSVKKEYMIRLLNISQKFSSVEDIMKELYYSYMKDRYMSAIMYKALKYRQPKKGLYYIYRKIGCDIMWQLHMFLISRQRDYGDRVGPISYSIISDFMRKIDEWDGIYLEKLHALKKRRILVLVEKNIILAANILLYFCFKIDISLVIFIVVNTIGLILFIILDYECCIEDGKCFARNLADKIQQRKKTRLPAHKLYNLYQLVGGMGLIINISIVVARWLGPVV